MKTRPIFKELITEMNTLIPLIRDELSLILYLTPSIAIFFILMLIVFTTQNMTAVKRTIGTNRLLSMATYYLPQKPIIITLLSLELLVFSVFILINPLINSFPIYVTQFLCVAAACLMFVGNLIESTDKKKNFLINSLTYVPIAAVFLFATMTLIHHPLRSEYNELLSALKQAESEHLELAIITTSASLKQWPKTNIPTLNRTGHHIQTIKLNHRVLEEQHILVIQSNHFPHQTLIEWDKKQFDFGEEQFYHEIRTPSIGEHLYDVALKKVDYIYILNN